MSSKAEATNSPANIVMWVIVSALVAAGVYGNMVFQDESLLYRILGLVVLGLVALFAALQTTQGAALASLVKEARIEIRKVVWPTHQETLQTTMLVLAVVLIVALILWGLDGALGWAASKIIG
ncbi:MAG: preprotein translocase subunit SecE [Pseudomonadales bacterium]